MRRNRSSAFTLIELLVVVAVVASLVALLIPALEGARQRSLTAGCMFNERQLGIGYNLWVKDHDDTLIPITGMEGNGVYAQMLQYVPMKTFSDPAADDPPTFQTTQSLHYGIQIDDPSVFVRCGGWGYCNGPLVITSTMGPTGTLPGYANTGPVKSDEILYPTTTALFACRINAFYPCGWVEGGMSGISMNVQHSGPGLSDDRGPWPLHGPKRLTLDGQVNIVRLDNSVRTYNYKELVRGYLTPPIAGGYGFLNIARNYLWSGFRPQDPNQRAGWLSD